ncbi:response regulator [Erythrobacter litoralis HTCC2594]|uniref:diguanylate cyclase n=2 Tax=Erythrobacter litoralis TaxID=39960 RepID=Q2N9G7_ERYLH|nr:response regulator [Erythrobacter litoralis HTCC2594]
MRMAALLRSPQSLAVRTEVMRAMVEREDRVAPANVVSLCLFGFALFLVAQPALLGVALLLRIASLVFVRGSTRRLAASLEAGLPSRWGLTRLTLALVTAGATWAGLMVSLDPVADPPMAVVAVSGMTLVAISLVIVTYGPIRRGMTALVGAFCATIFVAKALDPAPLPLWTAPIIALILVGSVLFSRGMVRHSIDAAQMTVENRALTATLQGALQEAEHNARHDALTGLLNRRAFFGDYADPPAAGRDRFLLMIDLDHFKRINDNFGHDTGDIVLRAMAEQMQAVAADFPEDTAGCVRLGGEEFILVIDGIDERHAALAAENLRLRARRIVTAQKLDPQLRVSASIGLARQREHESLDDVLQRSDLALYRAKDRGRDQVALAA